MVALHIFRFFIPVMSLLSLIHLEMLSSCENPIHDRPLGYRWTVDPGAGRNWNPALFENRMAHEVIKTSRKCMNKLQAVFNIIRQCDVNKTLGLSTYANLQVLADP